MIIDIRSISKKLGSQYVLEDISLQLESGQIYGIKGRNGAGKTMLMRAICGLIRLTEGEILVDGEVLRKDISFPRSIGALIETPGFINNFSGYENLKIITSIKGIVSDEKIKETMELLGLDPRDKKPFRKFSLGMKQKLGIAAAIIEEPELIILDEPTNALDEKSRQSLKDILERLRDKNTLIIVSCHDTEDLLELSDQIIEMQEGRIVSQWKVKQ